MSEIKQRRGRQLGVLTRLRRQVFVLIDTRSSRTKLVETIPELDRALAKLDMDDFLMALRRFIARRGRPRVILSDNGANLVAGQFGNQHHEHRKKSRNRKFETVA